MEKVQILKRLKEIKDEFDVIKDQILQEIKNSENRIKTLIDKLNSLEKEYYELVEKVKNN